MKRQRRYTALILGDSINSELIHPAMYFSLDPNRVKQGLFMGISPTLRERVTEDTLIVAGRNFGCGSSREVSVQALSLHGVQVLVAESFSRIFFRNCINNGVLPTECPGAYRLIQDGAPVVLDLDRGVLTNEATGMYWDCRPLDAYVSKLLEQWI